MLLEKWTTIRPEHIQLLAQELAKQSASIIAQLEPIADCEELLTFSAANPTPVEFMPQHPAWRLESVAARVIEGVAVAAHEPLTEFGYRELARILLEHAVYLHVYPDGDPRPKLAAGSALALTGSVCASLPQSELWRLAGFGRISAVLAEVAPAPNDSHLILPIDIAFSLANERNLPILGAAIDTYNTVLKRDFTSRNRFDLPLSDSDFFDALDLDFPGMEAVKTAVCADDMYTAKTAYVDFRKDFLDSQREKTSAFLFLEKSDTYTTAKTYLESLLQLSIFPTPAIIATTEIGIATHLLPECRGSEQLHKFVLQRFKWIADTFFHPDGFHKERTLLAQTEAAADFARFLWFQSDVQDEQTKELRATLERLVAVCIHLSKPDRSFPPLGPLLLPDFDVLQLCTITESSFKYPDTTSHALPETGLYVMRDNWEPDAQYLFFNAHLSGESNDPDTSQLSLYAHGQQLMTGSYRVLETTTWVSDIFNTQWITTPAFDWLEKWYQATDLYHKRAIFYLKGEYFILHDLVLSDDALSLEVETLEQIFRLDQNVDIYMNTGVGHAWTQTAQETNLFIGTLGMVPPIIELAEEGIVYRYISKSPSIVNTLLLPMKPGIKARPTTSIIPVTTDDGALATGFTLVFPNRTDTFLISDDGLAEMSAEDIRFVGEYLFLRRGVSGDVRFILLNGQYLQVDSEILADLAEPRESYVRM